MSDEESFVILGSSPQPSLRLDQQDSLKSQASLTSPEASLNTSVIRKQLDNADLIASLEIQSTCNSDSPLAKSNGSSGASGGSASLAASFILGEVNAEVLKNSVYSQFPSLCSMENCADDVGKLQNFMTEHVELKNTLAKVNETMTQFYGKTMQWREDMQRMEEEYKEQLQDCQKQIATLRNENHELKNEVSTNLDQLKLCDNLQKKDHDHFTQVLSEKSALIANMRAQIEKLEQQQQLGSFEYLGQQENQAKPIPDDGEEQQKRIKDMERRISELLAENLDLKDVQNRYIEEIDCLKVNLTAAEELHRQFRIDIDSLKVNDVGKSSQFARYESEIALLRQQMDVYSKDFVLERTSREQLAGEKDQLLQDLRALQRKNQELIEAAQKHWENMDKRAASSSPSPSLTSSSSSSASASPGHRARPSAEVFNENPSVRPIRSLPQASGSNADDKTPRCPVCNKIFKTVQILERHVNDCLDRT